MSRIDLKTYYKNIFKEPDYSQEKIKGINAAHAISSDYYDVQFGRNSIIYRDQENILVIPVEHDMAHALIIYLDYFIENNKCDMDVNLLKKRISTILTFLNVKYQYE